MVIPASLAERVRSNNIKLYHDNSEAEIHKEDKAW